MNKIIGVPLGQDLMPLSVYWHQQQIAHRICEERGEQVVYAAQQYERQMQQDYQRFASGELELRLERKRNTGKAHLRWTGILQKYPVTLLFVLLSVAGFLIAELEIDRLLDLLVIQSMDRSGLPVALGLPQQISVAEYLAHGHYWRLLTPIFLHFGWVHIVFNMLWLWELGRRVEPQGGSLHLLCVIVVIGIASNLYQAEATPFATFGGMSGVIYGLLGYCAVFNLISPNRSFQLPWGVYILMLASLLIGYLGLMDFLARMANTAHMSGLIIGLVMGCFSALIYRYLPARS